MLESRRLRVGDHNKAVEKGADKVFPSCATGKFSSLYPMPQFCDGDGGNFQLLALSSDPAAEIKGSLLAFDDHVGVDHDRHLSFAGRKDLRAACRSLYHALASSSGKSTFVRASASSL